MNGIMKTDYSARFKVLIIILVIFFHFTLTKKIKEKELIFYLFNLVITL